MLMQMLVEQKNANLQAFKHFTEICLENEWNEFKITKYS